MQLYFQPSEAEVAAAAEAEEASVAEAEPAAPAAAPEGGGLGWGLGGSGWGWELGSWESLAGGRTTHLAAGLCWPTWLPAAGPGNLWLLGALPPAGNWERQSAPNHVLCVC